MLALGLGCLVLAPVAGSSSLFGCTTHQCDSATVRVPSSEEPLAQQVVYVSGDEVVWDSAPETGQWLDYEGNQTYVVTYPPRFAALAAWTYATQMFEVSTSQSDPVSNKTAAVGQLAEVTNASATGFSVLNATCQKYYLRFEVRAPLVNGLWDASVAGVDP